MEQKNKFDLVMDYIDANIHKDLDSIKKGIYNLIGYNSNSFGQCFLILTGITLNHYIITRRMYFAGQELYEYKEKSITEIALEYGYSEQSAFSRAMKTFYNCTPNEVRKGKMKIPNEKYSFAELYNDASNKNNNIFNILEKDGIVLTSIMNLIIGLEEASTKYGFDIDTCYKIADLAEILEINPVALAHKCFELMIEQENNPCYCSPKVEAAIECGIESDEELNEICKYFNCKYYDLDELMVAEFRKQINCRE